MIYHFIIFIIIGVFVLSPLTAQAKDNDQQDQIILLNDSAAALEDTDPDLSKSLSEFADQKEKEWEDANANKAVLPTPVTDKDLPRLQQQIRILKAAALAMKTNYPLIAKGLNKMAKDLDRKIEIEE